MPKKKHFHRHSVRLVENVFDGDTFTCCSSCLKLARKDKIVFTRTQSASVTDACNVSILENVNNFINFPEHCLFLIKVLDNNSSNPLIAWKDYRKKHNLRVDYLCWDDEIHLKQYQSICYHQSLKVM